MAAGSTRTRHTRTTPSWNPVTAVKFRFKWHQKMPYKLQLKDSGPIFRCFSGFTIGDITVNCGDCIHIRSESENEEERYDIARLLFCYDTGGKQDNIRGRVQWYSRLSDINMKLPMPEGLQSKVDYDHEVVQDNRNFSNDIDLETVISKCYVNECNIDVEPKDMERPAGLTGFYYVCRLALGKPSKSSKCCFNPISKFSTSKDMQDKKIKIIYSPGKENIPPHEVGVKTTSTPDVKGRKKRLLSPNENGSGSHSKRSRQSINTPRDSNTSYSGVTASTSKQTSRTPNRNLCREFDKIDSDNVSKDENKSSKRHNNIGSSSVPKSKVKSSITGRVKDEDIADILEGADVSDLDESDSETDSLTTEKIKVKDVIKVMTVSCANVDIKSTTPVKSAKCNGTNDNLNGTPKRYGLAKTETPLLDTPNRRKLITLRGTPNKGTAVKGTPVKGTPIKGTPKRGTTGTPSRKATFPCSECLLVFNTKYQLDDHLQDDHDVFECSPDESPTPKKKTGIRNTPRKATSEFSCSECDKVYKYEKALQKHQENIHKTTSTSTKPSPLRTTVVKIRSGKAVTKLNTDDGKVCATRTVPGTTLEEARARLHVSAVPDSLPCREDECAQLFDFIHSQLTDGSGGCMYVSGVPGTGKTATVREVVRMLRDSEESGEIPQFTYIEVNALRLAQPRQVWSEIWSSLTGQKNITADHAVTLLERRFRQPGPRRSPTVLLVDELDLLWTRKQDVLYNLFEWPCLPSSQLIVVAIANTMDLPERVMMARVASRLGLTRLTFHPYTFQQLQEIVNSRLAGLDGFESDAVELVCRKVAAVSGDARRALDICRRAAELAENDAVSVKISPGKSPSKKASNKTRSAVVGLRHVNQALQEMFTSPKIMAIRCCSDTEQQVLRAIVAEFQRTGVEETTLDRVYDKFVCISACEDELKRVSLSNVTRVINRLSAQHIIITEAGKKHMAMRINLNLSVADVQFALNAKNAI